MSGISTGKPAKSITKRTASKEANDPRVPATVTASATLAGEGTMVAQQYDTDVVAWSERQAELLRRRAAGVLVNDTELDWLNLAEEIEAVGASTRRELRNRLVRLLQHLLKWYFQPEHRSRSWRATILTQRQEIEDLLADNPSLRNRLPELFLAAYPRARTYALNETGLLDLPPASPFTVEYALGDQLGNSWEP
ncbi:MAG: DUF29 domain-containing protein [Acetobacteraceae bacterium]